MKCYTYGISSGSDINNLQGLMFVLNTPTSGPLICAMNHPRFGGVFVWFGLILNVPVNSYCHVRTVSSPNHTVFLGKLDKAVNHSLPVLPAHTLFVTDNNPS